MEFESPKLSLNAHLSWDLLYREPHAEMELAQRAPNAVGKWFTQRKWMLKIWTSLDCLRLVLQQLSMPEIRQKPPMEWSTLAILKVQIQILTDKIFLGLLRELLVEAPAQPWAKRVNRRTFRQLAERSWARSRGPARRGWVIFTILLRRQLTKWRIRTSEREKSRKRSKQQDHLHANQGHLATQMVGSVLLKCLTLKRAFMRHPRTRSCSSSQRCFASKYKRTRLLPLIAMWWPNSWRISSWWRSRCSQKRKSAILLFQAAISTSW